MSGTFTSLEPMGQGLQLLLGIWKSTFFRGLQEVFEQRKFCRCSQRVGKGLRCVSARVLMKGGGVSTEQLFHSPDAGQDALPAEEKEREKKDPYGLIVLSEWYQSLRTVQRIASTIYCPAMPSQAV